MKYLLYMSFIILLISCGSGKKAEIITSKSTDTLCFTHQQIQLAEISTGTIQRQNLSTVIKGKGRIVAKPQNRAKVSAPMPGYIKNIYVQNGQQVKKGNLLLSLVHRDYIELQKNYLQTKSQYEVAQRNFERQKKLKEANAINAKSFDLAKSENEQLKAEMAALKLQLQLLQINVNELTADNMTNSITITAPVTGTINSLEVALGQFVNQESILFEIIGQQDFLVEIQIFERDINKIDIGQFVSYDCNIPESKGKQHYATIIHVGNYVSGNTKTFKALAQPKSCELGMRHGIFVDAKIHMQEKNVAVLPEDAVFNEDNESFVFIAHNDTMFIKESISQGGHYNGYIEIPDTTSLSGKKIVTTGGNYILAEMNKD